MLNLATKSAEFSGREATALRSLLRLSANPELPEPLRAGEGYLVTDHAPPPGFAWYVRIDGVSGPFDLPGPELRLPSEFSYLGDGDILRLVPGSKSVRVIFRKKASINSFLLTERCNNLCLMCSQPPRNVDDRWLAEELLEALPLIDRSTHEIMLSGGEPTLLGNDFIAIVRKAKSYLPNTALHILSNGRSFADAQWARDLGQVDHPDLMVGIPLYCDVAHVHDYVVQAKGAYDETIRGILNLKQAGVAVELRVVLHKQTVPRLAKLAEFITRNLLFVDHVALMGLEMTGFTRANMADLWIDPFDYRATLTDAVGILRRSKIRTSIYNSQLCLMDEEVWPYAVRSISDWKQQYLPTCEGCAALTHCGGFFSSATYRYSEHIKAIEPA